MFPINDFIFSNPDWASIPIRTVLGLFALLMFGLSLRYGPNQAVEVVQRFRWYFVGAFGAAAVWGLYASSVLHPLSPLGR